MKWFNRVMAPSSSRASSGRYGVIVAVLAICAVRAQADESPPPSNHEHGVAKLMVVLQGQRLSLGFDSPAVNLVGFEHAPQSEAEQRAASYAKGALQQAPRLFITSPGANCRLFSAKVDEPAWDRDADPHDYRARYVFQCQRPQLLQSIDVQLINQLTPGTKLLTELTVGDTRRSLELSENRTTVRFTQ